MKRKFLCTLLCVTMAFSTLVGCGAKEITSTNESVEAIETEVENEPTEEVSEKATEESKETNEEIVEETFVESKWKEENIVYGRTEYTPFGYYNIIGPLEGNPNLEQYEINFDGHIFQVVMPKDVGNSIEYNEERHILNFFNKDSSKVVSIVYTKGAFNSLTATSECEYIMKELGADTTNEDIIVLDETTYKAYQFGKTEVYPNLAYLGCWNIGSEKMYKDKMYENVGYNYRLFYGETNETFNRETVKTIMESFTFLTDESESYVALNQNQSTTSLNTNNQLDSETLERFGLGNTNLTFKPDTIIETNEDSITITVKNVTEEDIRTYFTEITNVVTLTGVMINTFDLEEAIGSLVNEIPATYNYSTNGNEYSFMVNMSNNVLEMKIKIK